tara:strand:- start:30 stop:275 length:246 start_codon:yes stop_codon:yes gene_type:complete
MPQSTVNNNTPPTPTINERVDRLDGLYFGLKNKVDRIDAEFLQYKRDMVDKLNSLGLGAKSAKNKKKKKKRKKKSATKKRR